MGPQKKEWPKPLLLLTKTKLCLQNLVDQLGGCVKSTG